MWGYANQVTLVRFACVPGIVLLMVYEYHWSAFALLLLAGLTDVVDGLLARRMDDQTQIGAYLDPAADKALAFSIYATAVYLSYIPLWLFGLVVVRDVLIAVCYHLSVRMGYVVEIHPLAIGKVTTFMQVGLIVWILFFLALGVPWGLEMTKIWVVVVGVLTCASGGAYFLEWLRALRS